MLQYLIIHFPLYHRSIRRLQEVKMKRKLDALLRVPRQSLY